MLSIPIVGALRMALRSHNHENVFHVCSRATYEDDGLPAKGMMLRRTYRTVCADCGVDELLSHCLLNHSPPGISARYVAELILSAGPGLRAAQRRIFARMLDLLGYRRGCLRSI